MKAEAAYNPTMLEEIKGFGAEFADAAAEGGRF